MKKIFFIAIIFALLFSAAGASASLSILPAKTELIISPGQAALRNFSIINNGSEPVKLKISVKDYRQTSSDGTLEFYDAEKNPASAWIIPQYSEIGLNPLETKNISFIVNMPADISSGGHYGAMLFNAAEGENGLSVENFGEPVLVTVTGNEKMTAIASNVNFKTGMFQEGNPVVFSLAMENTGKTHFTTMGKVVVKDWLGKEIGNFDAGQMIVYPSTERIFKWQWTDSPRIGIYKTEMLLSQTNSNDKQMKNVGGMWFVVFPWRLGLITLFSIAVAAILARKRLGGEKIRKASQKSGTIMAASMKEIFR